MMFILGLLIFLPKILLGFAIAHFVWQDSDIPALTLKFAVGLPLGLALSATAFFIVTWLGISPKIYSWIEFWLTLSWAVIFLVRFVLSKKGQIIISKPSRQSILGAAILLAGAVLFISAFWFYSRKHPFGFEDAWSMWNFNARFIFRENSPAVLLKSQFYNRFHPDYPVELSLNIAWGWFILNSETPSLAIALALLIASTPALITWATLRKRKGIFTAAAGSVVMLFATDFFSAIGQYADPLLTLHFISTVALFYSYLKSKNPRLLLLTGLLAGFSAWVKNEGLLFIGVLTVVCIVAALIQLFQWRALKLFALGLIGPLLIVPFYKHVVAWQNDLFSGTNSIWSQLFDSTRWVLIGKSFFIGIIRYANWPISIVVVLLLYIILTGFDQGEGHHHILLGLLFSGQFAGYFFIYLITPHDLQWHIDTSMERLISHIIPLFILWVFLAASSPELNAPKQLTNPEQTKTYKKIR